jgi:hypothetical protein
MTVSSAPAKVATTVPTSTVTARLPVTIKLTFTESPFGSVFGRPARVDRNRGASHAQQDVPRIHDAQTRGDFRFALDDWPPVKILGNFFFIAARLPAFSRPLRAEGRRDVDGG